MKVSSVVGAFEYVMQHYAPPGLTEQAELKDTYIVISIQDTHTGGFGVAFTESSCCKGVLTLYFDDVVREVEGAVAFNEDLAEQIIRFLLAHQDAETLLVHCYAGQSRSLAVGLFAFKRLLGRNNEIYFRKRSPNMLVYETLERVWIQHFGNTVSRDNSFSEN